MTKIVFTLLFLFVNSLSYAKDTLRTKEYERCVNKADAVESKLLECVSEEYSRQGRRLNATYRSLMGSIKGDRRKQLLNVQGLWEKYTEANCEFFFNPDENILARMLAAECKVTARIERVAELEELRKGY